jgi:hypothetical protein
MRGDRGIWTCVQRLLKRGWVPQEIGVPIVRRATIDIDIDIDIDINRQFIVLQDSFIKGWPSEMVGEGGCGFRRWRRPSIEREKCQEYMRRKKQESWQRDWETGSAREFLVAPRGAQKETSLRSTVKGIGLELGLLSHRGRELAFRESLGVKQCLLTYLRR